MNKSIIYSIIGVVVVAGAIYGFSHKKTNAPTNTSSTEVAGTNEQQTDAVPASGTGTVADFMKKGGDWKCEVHHKTNMDSSNGTVYISGKQLRGDFSSTVPQVSMTVESHFISDSTNVYAWSNMTPQGFKLTVDQSLKTKSGDMNIYNQNFDYNCIPWNKDAAQFTPPASITFTAYAQ